jgi:hypothetical protein
LSGADLATVLRGVQDRQKDCLPVLPERAGDLWKEIRGLLVDWSNRGLLRDPAMDIYRLVKPSPASDGVAALTICEPINFRRDPAQPHFTRYDGAWFDFHVTVREVRNRPLELIAYGFELRFPHVAGAHGPAWIRFDLNPSGHDNDLRGVRAHLHPSSDDWSLPSPVLSPTEMLYLFVVGITARDPERPRAAT